MILPYDTTRCLGFNCDRKGRCERYLQRDHAAPHTPYTGAMCGIDDFFIPSWPDETRIDVIGQNGNDGDHYQTG